MTSHIKIYANEGQNKKKICKDRNNWDLEGDTSFFRGLSVTSQKHLPGSALTRRSSLFAGNWHRLGDQGTQELPPNHWHVFSTDRNNEVNVERLLYAQSFCHLFRLEPMAPAPPGIHSAVPNPRRNRKNEEWKSWTRMIMLPSSSSFFFHSWLIFLLPVVSIVMSGTRPLPEWIECSARPLPRKKAWPSTLSAVLVATSTPRLSPPCPLTSEREKGMVGANHTGNILCRGEWNWV